MNSQPEIPLSLEAQFDLIKLKLHLEEHPEQSAQIALMQFRFYLEASEKLQRLQAENKELQAKLNPQSPSLFPVPNQALTKLQQNYDELLESYAELQRAYLDICEDNKNLRQLLDILAPHLPASLKERGQKS